MRFTLALLIVGILVLAGTAGESDANMGMPLAQFLAQSCVGLALLFWGVRRANNEAAPGG